MRMRPVVLLVGVIALATACGSSNNKTATTPPTSTTPNAGASVTSATASSAPLPDPCTLLTTQDVAAFFDGAPVTAKPSTGPVAGTARCDFNLTAGSQAKQVSIKTLTDFASNPGYAFPSPSTTVPGIGDLAVIETTNTNEGRVTVKLGGNAIEITVDFVDKPQDNSFLTQLAQTAVGRA